MKKQDADLSQEVDHAFSTKPCFGNMVRQNQEIAQSQINTTILGTPVMRRISENCQIWSGEEYKASDSMMPAVCQACKCNTDIPLIKGEEHFGSSLIAPLTQINNAKNMSSNSIKAKVSKLKRKIRI